MSEPLGHRAIYFGWISRNPYNYGSVLAVCWKSCAHWSDLKQAKYKAKASGYKMFVYSLDEKRPLTKVRNAIKSA